MWLWTSIDLAFCHLPAWHSVVYNSSYITSVIFILKVLLKLMSIKTPITDADSIRALACKVSYISLQLCVLFLPTAIEKFSVKGKKTMKQDSFKVVSVKSAPIVSFCSYIKLCPVKHLISTTMKMYFMNFL